MAISESARRIQRELEQFLADPPPNCRAGPKGLDAFEWTASVPGPPGTVYEGGVFDLDIHFSQDHPYTPPRVTFRTPIYHCNVDTRGQICLDILGRYWSPAFTVSWILRSITSLLSECHPMNAISRNIASQYLRNREEHDRIARLWTQRYATK